MTKVYDNSGALFKNDRKKRDGQPDYRGGLIIGGQEYWISGWRKDGKQGQFISLSFKAKDDSAERDRKQDKAWDREKTRYQEQKRTSGRDDDGFDSPF